MLLDVKDLDVRYGRNHAVKQMNLSVDEQEIVTVLGANGAGKSSLLKALHGLVSIQGGTVSFDGNDITRASSAERVQNNLALVPEGRQILVSMTVHENLLLGGYRRQGRDLLSDIDLIYERFPNLGARSGAQASVLSGGEQQMTALGRALMARPTMILLDEPSMGLAPQLVEEIFEIVQQLNQTEQVTFLLAEQNTNMALRYSHYGYILENGRIVMEGDAASLADNDDIKEFYLGISKGDQKASFRSTKHYRRRKRWLG